LQKESAREERDERHIAPLQLEVIRRAIALWTNPDDLVLDPFGGIGSTSVVALQEKRRTVMVELKKSYFEQGVRNLHRAAANAASPDLFTAAGMEVPA
jgi:DNA modification methylase